MVTPFETRRSSRLRWLRLSLAGLVAAGLTAGCAGGMKTSGAGGAGGLGGAGGVPDVASPGLAIIDSDYKTTSVSLYDPATGKLADGCISSATASAVVTQPLSFDVVLPSQPQTGGKLVLIDRTTSVLTFVDPATCTPTAQLSVGTGFSANPHDIVTLSSTKAYVSRYELNGAPTAITTDYDEGDDLLIIDPTLLAVTGRISLSAYATLGPNGEPTQARPDRMVLAGGLVYVTLNSIDKNFAVNGPGRVVIIDPTTDHVVNMIDLPYQKDCSGMTYVAATLKLYVACGGAFGDPMQVAQSALVEFILSGPTPLAGVGVQAATLGPEALNPSPDPINPFYAAIAGSTVFVSTLGQYPDMNGVGGTSDAFYAVSLVNGQMTTLATGAAGDLGAAVVDAATNRAFLPDANFKAPLMHIYDASTVPPTELTGFEPNPSTHLPPRSVAAY